MCVEVVDNVSCALIRKSPIEGYGLFAARDIDQGEILAHIDGQRVPWSVYRQYSFAPEWHAVSPGVIATRQYRTKFGLINHARQSNVRLFESSFISWLVAGCDIAQGEELLLDYREQPLPQQYLESGRCPFL